MSKNDWNLKDLFEDEKELNESIESITKRAKVFEELYSGKLEGISEDKFANVILEYENILEQLAKCMTYAFLKFAEDSKNGSFYAKYQNLCTKCNENIIFFELEFNQLPETKQDKIIKSNTKYSYYIESLKENKKHQLSQKEESVLLKKDQTGASAFSRLFDEHFSNMRFLYNGKRVQEEEILSLLSDKDREVRKKASDNFTKELKKHQHLLGYIFNMVKSDLNTDCEIRNYQSAEEPRHIENKISQNSVDALIRTAESSFNIVQDYYDKKREILGYDKLYDYDRYAPISSKEDDISFDDAKKIVLDTFSSFSPKFGEIAKEAFKNGWIDVYPKENKRSGAFSHPAVPSKHPYVLLNYTNKRRDLFTLAHELGHAIHQYLSRDVGYISSDTPLTTSETASVFAEMLVFDEFRKSLKDEDKKALLASKIEDIFATLYRQINFTTFERAVHSYEGELSLYKFNAFWMRESRKMFGDSVTLRKGYSYWWSYIPHFIHSPFYCYAYSYGQLLVLALYSLYKSGKMDNFVEKYEVFLSAGGSKSPRELVGYFGFDIEDDEFWQIGLQEVRKLVDEFKEL